MGASSVNLDQTTCTGSLSADAGFTNGSSGNNSLIISGSTSDKGISQLTDLVVSNPDLQTHEVELTASILESKRILDIAASPAQKFPPKERLGKPELAVSSSSANLGHDGSVSVLLTYI